MTIIVANFKEFQTVINNKIFGYQKVLYEVRLFLIR
jgi:hypothetical protein